MSIFSPWHFFLIRLLFTTFPVKAFKENNHDFLRCHTRDRESLQIIPWEQKQNAFLSKLYVFSCSAGFQRWDIPRKHKCGIWNAETPVTMDNSQVASCQNFLMSIQSASNLDL